MKRLVAVAVVSTLVGCSPVGVHSKPTHASEAAQEAELTALRAQIEEQSQELRMLRGQLALARAETQGLRAEAELRSEQPKLGPTPASDGELPWAKQRPKVATHQEIKREMHQLYGDEDLVTTADVPDLPAFIEEQPLIEAQENDADVRGYRRGLSLIKEQKFDEALRELTAFLETNPNHAYTDNALFWCGEVHYLRREYAQALRSFEQIEKQHPWGNKLPDALYRIGQIHLKRGDRARAQAYFDKVREQFPDTAAARLALREDAS